MPIWACAIESNGEKCWLYIRPDFQILGTVTLMNVVNVSCKYFDQ